MPVLFNHSTTLPNSLLHKDVTMYCEVKFRDASISASAVANWSRWPGRTESLAKTSQTHSLSGNYSRFTLSLSNVTRFDQADYTIVWTFFVSGKSCLFPCPTMSLSVRDECYFRIPQPMHGNMTITTPIDVPSLTLVANFTGDGEHYRIVWSNSSVYDLEYFGTSQKYFIKHSETSSCFFTEELIITNISVADAGMYTAEAAGYFESGNLTFFEVKIAQDSTLEKSGVFAPVLAVFVPVLGTLATGTAVVLVLCSCIYMHKKKKQNGKCTVIGTSISEPHQSYSVAPFCI